MKALIVVDSPKHWPFHIPNVEVVAARKYITTLDFSSRRGIRVFNLCRSYRYQSVGYYVSLLAAARGHKPIPSVSTIQDLKANEIVRIRSDELDAIMQRSLASIISDTFVLSVYFGRNLAERHARLARHLYRLFHAPLLRATFARHPKDGHWQIQTLRPIPVGEIPESHHEFVLEAASKYFATGRFGTPKKKRPAYDMAILWDPSDDPEPPSDARAIRKFVKAASELGIHSEIVSRDDYATLAEYDALFIRQTTNVHHYTYRFARRAAEHDMIVIDDPESILRCTNKVYLAELLEKHGIPTPKSLVVHRDNIHQVEQMLGFPCILKQPDSAFSQGVWKVENLDDLKRACDRLLGKSELLIAQEFKPTEFDWRIGILDQKPLYACKYFMARKHWAVVRTNQSGSRQSGRVSTIDVHDAPSGVLRAALKAANLMGDGLYGVDVKQIGNRAIVIEVNDNPSIEAGYEDLHLRDGLYRSIMQVFRNRLDAQLARGNPQ